MKSLLLFLLSLMFCLFAACSPSECLAANESQEIVLHDANGFGGFRGFLPFRRNVRSQLRQPQIRGAFFVPTVNAIPLQQQSVIISQPLLLVPRQ